MQGRTGFLLVAGVAGVTWLGWSQQTVSYIAREVSDGGVISGRVTLAGKAPTPKQLVITKDPEVCGKEPKYEEDLVVDDQTGGLKNVVVWLGDIKEGKAWQARAEAIALGQDGCRFTPRVLVVPAGETFDILNNDGILHNVHTRSSENRPINKAQPKFLTRLRARFDYPEMVRVECDAHDWMSAWIAVAAHPYYAVTDERGNYDLENIPPGTYTLEFWHEKLGSQTQQVTVPARQMVQTDVVYSLQ